MKLEARRRALENGRGEIIQIAESEHFLTAADVLARWRDDASFRAFFIGTLIANDYPGFFWEMPPLSPKSANNPFECVAIRDDSLALVRADDSDFAEHLNAAPEAVAVFRNLGGDALLIAPSRLSNMDCYGHIAAFLRAAPAVQQQALFQCVAAEAEKLLARGETFWISTSGLGVAWLHVRLDSHPKYYQHRPYAEL
ncbi:MAG TPA: hypothetical protein VLC74_02650 [Rhizomicrobium sp.]|nr:hypothetical protein [Rhizomicrobium sp.]